MEAKTPIVCFSSNDWNDIPSSKFHIMRYIGQNRTVLFIETIGIRQPKICANDAKRALHKIGKSLQGSKHAEAKIYTWSPLAIPFHKFRVLRHINSLYIATMVGRITSSLGIKKPVIWSYLPNAIGIIKRLDFSNLIYHCIDDYGEFTGAPKKSFALMEREMLRSADLTVVSSRELLALRRPHCKNIAYVPHGVDLKGFQRELRNRVHLPDLDSVQGPIAGFVGRIADWIDLELVCRCAFELHNWSFVFVGPSNVDLSRYRSIGNMIFLGRRDHRLIPHYIERFDVCLMPFVRNRLVASVNPLKMYEYLAVGKPVVSVPMPEIAEFADVITIAEPGDFCRAIQRTRETDSPSKREVRIDSVRGRSWEAVADTILETLQSSLRR